MKGRKTTEEYRNELIEKFGKNLLVEHEEYRNSKTPILHVCFECGNEHLKTPNNLLTKGMIYCNECAIKKRAFSKTKTTDEYIKELIEKFGKNLLADGEEYKKTSILTKHICIDCGEEHFKRPRDVLSQEQIRCNKCAIKKVTYLNTKTTDNYIKELIKKFGKNLLADGEEYKKANILTKHICIDCGEEHFKRPRDVLSLETVRCDKCSRKKRAFLLAKNTNIYIEELIKKFGKNLLADGEEYKNAHTAILHICVDCGKNHYKKPNAVLSQEQIRCNECIKSKFENKVGEILVKQNLNFKEQSTFEGMKYKSKLRCDFLVIINGIECIIEANGIQHYEYTPHFHNYDIKNYYNQIERDNIKATYAVEHNIPLLVIPYWEENNMEELILKFIDKVTAQQITSNIGQLAFVF